MCEAYIIPFLFGSFFTVCHPYIDVHFLKCFFCNLYTIHSAQKFGNRIYIFLLASVSSLIDQWEKSVNTGFSVGINSLNCVLIRFYREGPRKNNF